MQDKLASMRTKDLEWLERMDVTTAAASESKPDNEEEEEERDSGMDPEDDFKREMLL